MSRAAVEGVSTESLQSDLAAEQLRRDIISGAWSPGAKLKMRELLPRYDVGASPMREALARLAAEGFIEQQAQRGMRVPELTLEELEDLSFTRQLVESETIGLAAIQGNAAWKDGVISSFHLYERQLIELPDGVMNWTATEARHHQFHRAIVSGCPHPTLRSICDVIHHRLTRYRVQLAEYCFTPDEVIGEHRILMEAVLLRDERRAKEAARKHFGLTLTALSSVWRTPPTSTNEKGTRGPRDRVGRR